MEQFPICPKCHRKADPKEREAFLCASCGQSGKPQLVTMEEYEDILSGRNPRKKKKMHGIALTVIGTLLILLSAFSSNMIFLAVGGVFFVVGLLYLTMVNSRMPRQVASKDKKIRMIEMKIAEVKLRLEREKSGIEPDAKRIEKLEKEVVLWKKQLSRLK